jgi:hypothetical protein
MYLKINKKKIEKKIEKKNLKICRTSGPDVMSGRALRQIKLESVYLLYWF